MSREIYGKDVRKAFKLGPSIAVTLPKEFVKAHKIKPGDLFDIVFDQELHMKVIKPEEIKKYFEEKRGK